MDNQQQRDPDEVRAIFDALEREAREEPDTRESSERGAMANIYDCCSAHPTEPHSPDCGRS